MITILIAIVGITAITLAGSWYARKYEKPDALLALYVVFTAITQILAAKVAAYDLGFTTVFAPAAMLVFPVTFLITDIVNEKFGRRAVHKMIFVTLLTQVAMIGFLYVGTNLPAAPFWENQDAWNKLLGIVPRITFASWITFLISENLDAYLFEVTRKITKGKHLWARNVFSTIPSLTVDTVVFVLLAFAGTGLPVWTLMVGQFLTKYLVAVMNIPFMYLNRFVLGGARGNE